MYNKLPLAVRHLDGQRRIYMCTDPDSSVNGMFDCLFEIRKIAVCFPWLSMPGDYRVTDEALLAETM